MPTDLFVAASGWPSSALADVVPPACRRDVEAAPAPRRDGDDAVDELPVWRPRRAARHLVPAFSALHPVPASFRFEVSLERAGRWSAWVAGATISEARFAPLGGRTDGLAAEVDEFVAEAPAHAVRVRLRLRVDDRHAPLAAPWLVSLSAWDGSLPEPDTAPRGGAVRLAVPALSQMDADEAIRMRICSPASVAMVLAYWGARVDVAALAREIFHAGLDRYGVWPAAIRAAGRHGVAGYLLRFPDWPSAAWCLEQGLPVIASVRYDAGELAGAAIPETTGHLLVLTGYEGEAVLVNDPAAATAASVARRYRRDQLCRVWRWTRRPRIGGGQATAWGAGPPPMNSSQPRGSFTRKDRRVGSASRFRTSASIPSRSSSSARASCAATKGSRFTVPLPQPTTTRLFAVSGWARPKFRATLAPIEQPPTCAWRMPRWRRSWSRSSTSCGCV